MIKSEFGTDARSNLTFFDNIFRKIFLISDLLLPVVHLVSKLLIADLLSLHLVSKPFILLVDREGHANGNSTTDGNGKIV